MRLEPEAAAWIGANSAGEPRKALHILRASRNLAGRGPVTVAVPREALRLGGLYPGGLSRPQRDYLAFLSEM